MNEGEYLELADQFKNLIDKKDEELKSHYEEIKELKKLLMMAYSFVRILDELVAHNFNQPNIMVNLLETLRSFLSSAIDKHIFNEDTNE